jgi:hypothetical protein
MPAAWKLTPTGLEQIWKGEPLTIDENLTVSAGADRVYCVGAQELRAYALDSGKLLATVKGKDFAPIGAPGSNQWLAIVGNRLLLNPEGQHGGQSFGLLDLDLKPLSAWHPPHPSDCAYGVMALAYPVVDGRIFIRGQDGLYCYDLRKKAGS